MKFIDRNELDEVQRSRIEPTKWFTRNVLRSFALVLGRQKIQMSYFRDIY